jgi:hypothetical protein
MNLAEVVDHAGPDTFSVELWPFDKMPVAQMLSGVGA